MEKHNILHALDLAECIPEDNTNYRTLRELLQELRWLCKTGEQAS